MLPATDTEQRPRTCTPRQIEVLSLIANGCTLGQIALTLGISKRTVEHHVYKAKHRMGMATREQLLLHLALRGMIAVTDCQ